MPLKQSNRSLQKVASSTLTIALISTFLTLEGANPPNVLSRTSALFEYRWDPDDNYKKLYYYQSSSGRRARSTYYLVMSSKSRKTEINKIRINFPKRFDSSITTNQLKLCGVEMGGMLSKTKCKKIVPATFKVGKFEKKTFIEIYPNQVLPRNNKKYAVVMKIFNPSKAGMFQMNAFTQAPGDKPVSSYIGSWNIDIR